MKSAKLMCTAAIAFFAVLAIPVRLVAQDNQDHNHKHHHYKLIDLGTLGGPQSFLGGLDGVRNINRRGIVVGVADTPNSCPYHSGLISLAFRWREGSLKPLEVLSDGCFSVPNWINERGQIVGLSENGVIDPLTGQPEYNAVLWKDDAEILNLGSLGGSFSQSNGINESGAVVGFALNTVPDAFLGPNGTFFGTQFRAFLWRNGVMRDLGTLGGPDAYAAFVNDRGQVAGYSFTNSIPNPVATACGGAMQVPTEAPFFLEDSGSGMTNVGTLGGNCGFANDMNGSGVVVGYSDLAGDLTGHPFRWTRSERIKDLGTFGGTFGYALAVNDTGEIVGGATTQNDQAFDAFLWKNGVMKNLGTLAGDCGSLAQSINSKDQVTGQSLSCDGTSSRAFLWENGQMIDLNTTVGPDSDLQLLDALEINERGEIIGQGALADGNQHVFLLMLCDDKHPGIEGCDYSMAGAPVIVPQASPGIRNASRRTLPQSLIRRMSRYRFPGFAFGPRN
jgi:probable HAF family extracellular repeat protein